MCGWLAEVGNDQTSDAAGSDLREAVGDNSQRMGVLLFPYFPRNCRKRESDTGVPGPSQGRIHTPLPVPPRGVVAGYFGFNFNWMTPTSDSGSEIGTRRLPPVVGVWVTLASDR